MNANIVLLLLTIAFVGCSSPSRDSSPRGETGTGGQPAGEADSLPEGIDADDSLTSDLLEILQVRGGKDPNDHWEVDRSEGRVRIIKSRTDHRAYLPGTGVEFWSKDPQGEWRRSPTA